MSNRLIHATSPYLLQHAHNPVDWFEWGKEALDKAKKENKIILVSIGYSACHWCHVMERESFENEQIATIMNKHFVCIKVDREERPDIDHLYMDAVQAMGMHGGWPLNVFCTPDQKPFYGGTYFPPQTWTQVLQNIQHAYQHKNDEIIESAESLSAHLNQQGIGRFIQTSDTKSLTEDLEKIYQELAKKFDHKWGGLDKAPKFIMPSIWQWLLRYCYISKNEEAIKHLKLTLSKIQMGGIYDHIAGGFARYSVDEKWFVPHFEKMLYDNAQLLSLYAEAYQLTAEENFKTVVHETFQWLVNEMMSSEGGFYSALDADSEGEEGKFYVWTPNEITDILGADAASLIIQFYNITKAGNWEEHKNILWRTQSMADFLATNKLDKQSWFDQLNKYKKTLYEARKKRVAPGLDDKIITAWNAMTICGLTDAYKVCGDAEMLAAAERNIQFLEKHLISDGIIYRSYKDKRSDVIGFLDDYAYCIQAYLKLYQVTFKESYIHKANKLIEQTLLNFFDNKEEFFNYSSQQAEQLISSKKEIFDNVIPSSNALMAQNLFQAGIITDREDWKNKAIKMCENFSALITSDPNYMSYWALVWTEMRHGMAEVVFAGDDTEDLIITWHQHFLPFAILMGNNGTAELPLVQDKSAIQNKSTIYVCKNKTCKLPVHEVAEAIKQLS